MTGYTWDTGIIPECRLTNKTDSYATAYSKEDVIAIASKLKDCDGVGIHLEFNHLLSEREINLLITQCTLRCPILLTKKISFSKERQMIFIQKG